MIEEQEDKFSLNPCYSGICSVSYFIEHVISTLDKVLILVIVEYAL